MNNSILGRLMRLEFVLNRQMIVFSTVMVLVLAVFYPLLLTEVPVAVTVGVLYLALVPVSIISRASKFKSDSLVCVLPVSRRRIVLGKYLFIASVAAALFVLYITVLIVAPYEGFTARAIVDSDRMINSVTVIAVVGAMIVPLILRFGFNGVIFLLLGLNLLTVILFMVTAIGGAGNILDLIFHGIPEAIRTVRRTLGPVWYPVTMLGVAAAAQYISYRVSAALFARKEL